MLVIRKPALTQLKKVSEDPLRSRGPQECMMGMAALLWVPRAGGAEWLGSEGLGVDQKRRVERAPGGNSKY